MDPAQFCGDHYWSSCKRSRSNPQLPKDRSMKRNLYILLISVQESSSLTTCWVFNLTFPEVLSVSQVASAVLLIVGCTPLPHVNSVKLLLLHGHSGWWHFHGQKYELMACGDTTDIILHVLWCTDLLWDEELGNQEQAPGTNKLSRFGSDRLNTFT